MSPSPSSPGSRGAAAPARFAPVPVRALQVSSREDGDTGRLPEGSGFFAYRIASGSATSTGLLCGVSGDLDRGGGVLRHERVISDIVDRQRREIEARRGQEEPVLLAGSHGAWSNRLASVQAPANTATGRDADGRLHRVWPLRSSRIQAILEAGLPVPWIADGHHRREAVRRLFNRATSPNPPLLAALFPSASFDPGAVHRGIPASHPIDSEAISALEKRFDSRCLKPIPDTPSPGPGELILLLADHAWSFSSNPEGERPADLAETILSVITKGAHTAKQTPVRYFGGTEGSGQLAELIRSGSLAGGLFLPPERIADVESAAFSAHPYPPKTTWFVPKLLRGLVVLPFAPKRPNQNLA